MAIVFGSLFERAGFPSFNDTILFEDELIKLWRPSLHAGKYLLVNKNKDGLDGLIIEELWAEESTNINELIDIAIEYIKKNIEYKKGDRISSLMKLSALRK